MTTEDSLELDITNEEANSQDSLNSSERNNKEKQLEEALKEKDLKELKAKNEELVVFSSWIKKECKKDDYESKLKASTSGLFIVEDFFDNFITFYQNWYQVERSNSALPSREKLVQKLFNSSNPELYYIIIGKQAFTGFLINLKIEAPQKLGLPIYKGEPLSALNYLHPKDVMLEKLNNVSIEKSNLGIRFHFNAGENEFLLSFDSILPFAKILRNSKPTTVRYPEILSSLRGTAKQLPDLLAKFKKHKSKFNLLVPAKYRNTRDLEFYRLGELVLITKKQELLELYELKGKNRVDLINSELADSNFEKSFRKYRLRIYKDPGKSIAGFEVNNYQYKISVVAFLDYLEFLAKTKCFNKKIKGSFTVFTAIQILLDNFNEATPIDNRDVHKYIPSYLNNKKLDGKLKSPMVFLYSTIRAKNSFRSLDFVGEFRKKVEKKIEIKNVSNVKVSN